VIWLFAESLQRWAKGRDQTILASRRESQLACFDAAILATIRTLMNRPISYLLLVLLLNCSVALAQSDSVPAPPSPEPTPSSESAWPPSAQLSSQSAAPSASSDAAPSSSPGQYLVQPTPYVPPSAPSIYAGPVLGLSPPSPGLGLIPGASNPHWDISLDVLWLEQNTGSGIPLGFMSYSSSPLQTAPIDALWSDDIVFPLEPGIRFQLIGRITDRMAIEATCWGLQQWSVGRAISVDPFAGTVVMHSAWLQAIKSDDWLGYTYKSQVANVELNQRFKLSGLDPYRAFSWLWGVRYFNLSDDFTLSSSDYESGSLENINWKTKNNLVGMQAGLQWTWGADRFQLSTELKGGLFANFYSQCGSDYASGVVGFQSFDASHSGTDLAALFELSIMLRCRLTPCLWLRAGYQCYGITGLALGPRQLAGYDTDASVGLDGLSLGLDRTW
jgi:hypothetical protein